MTGRNSLRAATAACHQRVDDLFSGLNLGRREDYARFLAAQAAAFVPAEAALTEAGVETVMPDWAERRRSAALLEDLAALGVSAPEAMAAPALHGEAEVLGALYVLEGSRLGGQLLKRSVPAELPTRFLATGAPGAWRALIQMIDARLQSPEDIDAAARAAAGVFGLFERAGRRVLSQGSLA